MQFTEGCVIYYPFIVTNMPPSKRGRRVFLNNFVSRAELIGRNQKVNVWGARGRGWERLDNICLVSKRGMDKSDGS
jgi:hypothetical protein